jgi:ribosome-associated protein
MGAQADPTPVTRKRPPSSGAGLPLAHRAIELIQEKKGEEIVLLDLRKLGAVSDYFLIATGRSEVQVKAIAEHVTEELKKEGITPWHTEGLQNRRWVLVDLVDVVVHIFHPETREYYLLERLWGDAHRVDIPEE